MSIHQPQDSRYDYLRKYLIEETVEEYQENRIGRREMLRRVLLMTGSIPLTASILAACTSPTQGAPKAPGGGATSGPAGGASPTAATKAASPTTAPATSPAAKTSPGPSPATKTAPSPSPAAKTAASPSPSPAASSGVTVSPNDPAIEARDVQFSGPGGGGTAFGYLAQPRGVATAPGIIVIHENRGLTEHIKDMTRRYAKDGIAALAVDLLSRQGGTDRVQDPAQIPALLSQANQMDLVRDMQAGVTYLKDLPNVAGPKVGAVGYCYGGGMTWLLAVNSPADIGAANPYYGAPPQPIDDVQKLEAPVLAFYGETDQRINASIPAIEEAMAKYNKRFDKVVYPGAGHAFNNDTGGAYQAAAARDAYRRSVAFFKDNLRG